MFYCLSFSSFCHSHILKLLLPTLISHFWQCKISVCLADAEVFPHCSLGFIVLFVFFTGAQTALKYITENRNMKAAKKRK